METNFFAENMRHLRHEILRCSLAEVPAVTGFPKSTWSNYETGVSVPNLADFMKISHFFGISEYDLLHTELPEERPKILLPNDILARIEAEKLKKHTPENLKDTPSDTPKHQKISSKTQKIPPATQQKLSEKLSPALSPPQKKVILGAVSETEKPHGKTVKMPSIITVNEAGVDNILYVPIRARAGYLSGYGDPEFIETLPSFRMPGLSNGTYRMFEVDGPSMSPTLASGDRVICRWVESLSEISDSRVYVVVHAGGVVVKRLINRIQERGKLYLKSDTIAHRNDYPTLEVDAQDIKEIWYVVMRLTGDLKGPSDYFTRLSDLELQMEDIKKKLNAG